MDGSQEWVLFLLGICWRRSKGLDDGRMVGDFPPRDRFYQSRTWPCLPLFFCSHPHSNVGQCPNLQASATRVRDPARH
jgi:hypothetical protein